MRRGPPRAGRALAGRRTALRWSGRTECSRCLICTQPAGTGPAPLSQSPSPSKLKVSDPGVEIGIEESGGRGIVLDADERVFGALVRALGPVLEDRGSAGRDVDQELATDVDADLRALGELRRRADGGCEHVRRPGTVGRPAERDRACVATGCRISVATDDAFHGVVAPRRGRGAALAPSDIDRRSVAALRGGVDHAVELHPRRGCDRVPGSQRHRRRDQRHRRDHANQPGDPPDQETTPPRHVPCTPVRWPAIYPFFAQPRPRAGATLSQV